MKWIDLFKLAIKDLKGQWATLPVAAVAVAAFCLCYAGAIITTVQQEKALPYELIVSVESAAKLSDGIIAQIAEIPDVVAVTAVLNVPVTIKTGKYASQFTLAGVEAEYLNESFSQGGSFPEDSVMPYVVLNDSSCKLFSKGGKDSEAEAPEINWLNVNYSLQTDVESRGIASKVCGIFAVEEKEAGQHPAAYISLSVAKELLRKSGQSVDPKAAWVRVSNIGRVEGVSKAIAPLGFTVIDPNEELQARWDTKIMEMRYLLVLGVLSLLCSTALFSLRRKAFILEQKGALDMLRWLGMKQGVMNRLFLLQSLTLSFSGVLLGLVVSLSLPPFLPPELLGVSCFTLPAPFSVIIADAIICIVSPFSLSDIFHHAEM
jgi:hypothetical protein